MRSRLVILALLTLSASIATAGDHGKLHGQRTRVLCPHCTEPCVPTVTKGKETRHCWEVDTKTICIPKVRWPWEDWGKGAGKGHGKDGCQTCNSGCGHKSDGKCGAKCPDVYCPEPKCGRTRVVNVLMKRSYECSACKYTFEVSKGAKTGPLKTEPLKAEAKKVAPPVDYETAASTPSTARRVYTAPVGHTRR